LIIKETYHSNVLEWLEVSFPDGDLNIFPLFIQNLRHKYCSFTSAMLQYITFNKHTCRSDVSVMTETRWKLPTGRMYSTLVSELCQLLEIQIICSISLY